LDENFQTKDKLSADEKGYVILDKTPFYPEGGGQVGDVGIFSVSKKPVAEVLDVQRPLKNLIIHYVKTIKEIKLKEKILASVSEEHHKRVRANHTATHLVNVALRKILGDKVHQAGSYVSSEKFRFDYTCPRAMSKDEIEELEKICADAIKQKIPVSVEIHPLKDVKKYGAVTLIGETYEDPARFVMISKEGFKNPDAKFSLELCGGKHVDNTSEILRVKIIKDKSVSSGIRRIEGVAGLSVSDYLRKQEQIEKQEEKAKAERQKKQKTKTVQSVEKQEIKLSDGKKLIVNFGENIDMKDLRNISDTASHSVKKSYIFVFSDNDEKRSFILRKTKDLNADISKIAKDFAVKIKGSAGGREDFAQGGCSAELSSEEFIKILRDLL